MYSKNNTNMINMIKERLQAEYGLSLQVEIFRKWLFKWCLKL